MIEMNAVFSGWENFGNEAIEFTKSITQKDILDFYEDLFKTNAKKLSI